MGVLVSHEGCHDSTQVLSRTGGESPTTTEGNTMSSTIRQTIERHVPASAQRQYGSVIDAVVADLESGLDAACEALVEQALTQGISESRVRDALQGAGLQATPEAPAPASLEETVAGLVASVAALQEIADRARARGLL